MFAIDAWVRRQCDPYQNMDRTNREADLSASWTENKMVRAPVEGTTKMYRHWAYCSFRYRHLRLAILIKQNVARRHSRE